MKAVRIFVLLLCPALCAHAQMSEPTTELDTCDHLDEVVVTGVTGNTRIREIATPVSIISNVALSSHPSTNIIDAISRQPGVNQVTTGSGISKPVIRGLSYNRILVVNNGIRQEGQQWGDEHGIEIDGNSVNSVEILKGPASLMYGSDAMAGVIIMHEAPVMSPGEMYAEAGSEYQTNNGLFGYTLNYKGNQQGFTWDWRWSQKLAHDYHAPEDGYVPNSAFREQALNGSLGVIKNWGYSRLNVSYYHLTPGMVEVEDEYEEGGRDYKIEAPFQEVKHYKAVLNNYVSLGEGYLKAIAGYQQNRRQEFEEEDECGLDFRLHSINYDVRYVLPEWHKFNTNLGIGGMYQKSENLGEEFLIPAYNLFDIGVFATASRSFYDRLHLSGGLRYDHRNLHSLALEEEGEERFSDFRRNFGDFSGSLGAIYNINQRFDLKVNLSHGFRAPNMSELGSNGEHEGTFRYELGNKDLDPEHSWQFDLGLDYASRILSYSLALFANRINDYIYIQRTGEEMDGTPLYQFSSGDARILGGEARVILHLLHHLHFENCFSYVDAQQLHAERDAKYLPFTPAPRWLSTLHYDIPLRSRIIRGAYAEVESDMNFKQTHIMEANDMETPTSSYTLFNLGIGTNIHLANGRKLCSIGLSASNLFDKAYQSHLSRLKYAETYPITGRNGINNMGKNIGIKILFPIEMMGEN